MIRQAQMSSADLHDSQMARCSSKVMTRPITPTGPMTARRCAMNWWSRGIKDRIAYKARRGKKQPNWQKWTNKVAVSVRSAIERTNATMKNWYGMTRVRYLDLARAITAICNSLPAL
ncbi:hypothetical protein D3227_37015 [Mesorhizobium waimense]|uniref:Transposase IS4-like domain-containing protein n=1 Tax=Mesorhizobium waimense TaxID=1300307 RepID=A0A3A5JX45_9HYPH|nr:hypothetical protein D3227_37015 [Mesorhizobium waimense]